MLDLRAFISLFNVIMFTAIGLFKQVSCPEQPQCFLPNCVFAHNVSSQRLPSKKTPSTSAESNLAVENEQDKPFVPRKKRKLDAGDTITHGNGDNKSGSQASEVLAAITLPETISRPISPPLLQRSKVDDLMDPENRQKVTRGGRSNAIPKIAKTATISLNPRMLSSPPASHAVRMQLIKMLHEYMSLLNEAVQRSNDPSKDALLLSKDELMLQALTEEEAVAKCNPNVYANVVKLRIVKLKKMKVDEWKLERQKQIEKEAIPKVSVSSSLMSKPIGTGLRPEQEIAFLSRLLAKQHGLSRFGYVEKTFRESEVEEARKGVEAVQGWEQCDRCKTRFQVYPGRRDDDGALTSGGQCKYHPAKPRRPIPKDKADKVSKEPIYACCSENVGTSIGCTAAPSHVFKVSDPKRLALIMPFEETPDNPKLAGKHTAVCFDCEMGYTTVGLELIRLTATCWPSGDPLLDFLVRPTGEILDLNSQFSGVWPHEFTAAVPYGAEGIGNSAPNEGNGDVSSAPLRIVDSPSAARALLFSYLTPSTPLIGHALDNDLNVARIIHPSIVDTVLLYPHPRGLPIRFGLKVLMKKHLDRDIQMGGAAGHDSKEDARAAGELVRLRVKDMWEQMSREGWKAEGVRFLAPMTKAEAMKAQIANGKSAN